MFWGQYQSATYISCKKFSIESLASNKAVKRVQRCLQFVCLLKIFLYFWYSHFNTCTHLGPWCVCFLKLPEKFFGSRLMGLWKKNNVIFHPNTHINTFTHKHMDGQICLKRPHHPSTLRDCVWMLFTYTYRPSGCPADVRICHNSFYLIMLQSMLTVEVCEAMSVRTYIYFYLQIICPTSGTYRLISVQNCMLSFIIKESYKAAIWPKCKI